MSGSDKKSQEYPTEEPNENEPIENKSHSSSDKGSNAEKEEGSQKGSQRTGSASGEPKKKKFSIGVLIFTFLNLCGFVFCIAGMSIGQFEEREGDGCWSIWGYKPKCSGTWFRHTDWEDFRMSGKYCKKGESLSEGAQAFSVMSIIGGFLTTATAFLELFHFAELAVVATIMSCINSVATLVVWSSMLAMYWSFLCGIYFFAGDYKIGAGLALFITAWCVQMVANLVIIIEIGLGNAK
ncbi:amastin-like surface protein-like protein [Angomonas deanei]|uniref:Amastin surface glycoprotein, putative n=1 Tax=Angomonas deanei TaxID=59799 RepID=A0A7G2CG46_9TRYP|nr:amastin-like surface protein-like protein [Angomonas deanei]CAD2218800.1 Amastin surface glycoprotein, putative [Angomonas deanei]|eukprot:EPY23260.1 amastin-like surface protein-like protein [Angomonas deanei]